jgi:hypothetical protein
MKVVEVAEKWERIPKMLGGKYGDYRPNLDKTTSITGKKGLVGERRDK